MSDLRQARCSLAFAYDRPTRRRGASAAFIDPYLTAPEACAVWLPEASSCFELTAATGQAPCSRQAGISLPALPNVEHVLVDAAHRQHVVLRANGSRLQLTLNGTASLIAPVVACVDLRSVVDIATSSKNLIKLQRLLAPLPASIEPEARWTAHSMRLRDALVALDARRAGATFKEVAAVIYGPDRVYRDWPGTGLKLRVSRDFQRGLALCHGAYRALLA